MLRMHVIGLGCLQYYRTPKLSTVNCTFSSNMENVQKIKFQNHLLKSWMLSFRDKVTGHTLVALEKGRRVSVLCNRKAGALACMLAFLLAFLLAWGAF